MSGLIFKEPGYLPLLALIPPLWLLFRSAMVKRRAAMRVFSGTHPMKASEQAFLSRRRRWTMVCYCVAMAVFVIALARPAWERIPVEAGSRGRDVLFLLDVSNSMRAEDLAPSRLERAKQSILDCVESLQGDRVGLVIFAGSPSIVCPLTTDYGFFRRMLEEAAPENVSQGGTRIGDAIRKTVDKLLDEKRRGYQDLILITDGGDQESQPEGAAKELEELGVFLVVVGLGDERRGARIPVRPGEELPGAGEFMMYKGKPVLTRLESAPLKQMAKASRNGVYLNAGLRAFDLGEVYHRLVEHYEEEMQETSETTLRYRDEFQWFLGMGLIALCLPHLIGLGRRTPAAALVAAAMLGALNPGTVAYGQEVEEEPEEEGEVEVESAAEAVAEAEAETDDGRSAADYYNEAHRLHGLQLYDEAALAFRIALNRAGDDAELRLRACYNLGISYFKGGEAKVAQDQEMALQFVAMSAVAFRAALDYDAGFEDAAWNLELARRRERELLEALKSEREGEESEAEESESEEESEDGESSDEEGEETESEDMEETDESGEGKPSDYSASDLALDLENEGLPPPMLDPEDIFEEEAANNELRQKKGNKYQPVERGLVMSGAIHSGPQAVAEDAKSSETLTRSVGTFCKFRYRLRRTFWESPGFAFALFAVLFAGFGAPLFAADFTVRTVAPKEPVYLGQVFPCYVVVEGPEKPVRAELSAGDGLEARLIGEHATEENAVTRWMFTFECLARTEGEVAISGVAATAGGETVTAEPATVVVRAPAGTDKMRLKVSVSETDCYVGEPLLLTLEWHSELFLNGVRAVDLRLPALNDPRLKAFEPVRKVDPNDSNAIGVPVENRRIIAQLTENRRGDVPVSDIRFEQIIVPRSAGTLTIPGATLICSYVPPKDQKFSGFRYPSYFNNDFFDKSVKGEHERYLIRSEPFVLNVKPLPRRGVPESFTGIIGKVRLDAEAKPTVAAVSDPITLDLRLSGHPYPQTLAAPDLARQSALLHSFDVAPEPAKSSLDGGDRVFSQTIRPLRPNVKLIPSIRMGYFDPEKGGYGEVVSDPIPVTISAAVKVDAFDAVFSDGSRLRNEVKRSPAGIYSNYEGLGLLRMEVPVGWPGGRAWFWLALLLGPPAVYALLIGATQRMRFARRDPDGARARRAYAVFLRSIRSLKPGGKMDAPETVALLEKAVSTYVADRFGLSRGAASSDELARLLRQRRVDGELIEELENFWDHTASMQFSQRGRNGSNLESAARQIPEAIGKIERTLAS